MKQPADHLKCDDCGGDLAALPPIGLSCLENLTKAAQGAQMLAHDIEDAHSAACRGEDPASRLLSLALLELLADSVKLRQRLEQLQEAITPSCPSCPEAEKGGGQ